MPSSRSSIQPSPSSGLAGKAVMAVCLLASASAAAYFAYDARAARAAQAAARKAEPAEAARDDDQKPARVERASGAGDLVRLQLENRELKRRLAQMMSQAETGGAAPPAAERPRGGRGRWLDGLKERDPERYKQIMERREERRHRMDVAAQDRMARIEERLEANRAATEAAGGQESPQTQKQNELLNQISATMQELSGLREKWREVNQLPDDQRFDKAQELFQKSADLRGKLAELQQQDRDSQLRDLGSRLGLSDEQTDTLSKSVGQIVKDTSPPRGPGRAGAGGGRAGGGGRAR